MFGNFIRSGRFSGRRRALDFSKTFVSRSTRLTKQAKEAVTKKVDDISDAERVAETAKKGGTSCVDIK